MTPTSLQQRVEALHRRILALPPHRAGVLALQVRLVQLMHPAHGGSVPASDTVVVS